MLEQFFPEGVRQRRAAQFSVLIYQTTRSSLNNSTNPDSTIFRSLIEWLALHSEQIKRQSRHNNIPALEFASLIMFNALNQHINFDSILHESEDELHHNYNFIQDNMPQVLDALQSFGNSLPDIAISVVTPESVVNVASQFIEMAEEDSWFNSYGTETSLDRVLSSVLSTYYQQIAELLGITTVEAGGYEDEEEIEDGEERSLEDILVDIRQWVPLVRPAENGNLGAYIARLLSLGDRARPAGIFITIMMLRLNLEECDFGRSQRGSPLSEGRRIFARNMLAIWRDSNEKNRLNILNFFTVILNIDFLHYLEESGETAWIDEIVQFVIGLTELHTPTVPGAEPMQAGGGGQPVIQLIQVGGVGAPIVLNPSLGTGIAQLGAALNPAGASGGNAGKGVSFGDLIGYDQTPPAYGARGRHRGHGHGGGYGGGSTTGAAQQPSLPRYWSSIATVVRSSRGGNRADIAEQIAKRHGMHFDWNSKVYRND